MSDSSSALQKLLQTTINPNSDHISLAIRHLVYQHSNNGYQFKFGWIPGHTNILGNELADKLADLGRIMPRPQNILIYKYDILPRFKTQILHDHNLEWKSSFENAGRWYREIQQFFPKVPWFKLFPYINRRHITTIIRMRTNHCLTRAHLFKIKVRDSPLCDCGLHEDLDHIFFQCTIRRIPNLDMYKEFFLQGYSLPLNIKSVLHDINPSSINLLMKFITINKIEL